MEVFHIEHKNCNFTAFDCNVFLSIILPIWNVHAKLFETAVKTATQSRVITQ